MVKGFSKKLVDGIVIVSLLLALCVAVDYATNDTITNIDGRVDEMNTSNLQLVNDTTIIGVNDSASNIVVKSTDKIHIDKTKNKKKVKKVPTVTITSRPSCGCGYGYYWHTFTFKDYCPNCGRHNCLINKHKWAARYENELTCKYCDSDFCGCCGKEKMSYSKKYLTKA